jgi:hypothetical protein
MSIFYAGLGKLKAVSKLPKLIGSKFESRAIDRLNQGMNPLGIGRDVFSKELTRKNDIAAVVNEAISSGDVTVIKGLIKRKQ